jgi:hypothetical protein
MNWTRAAAVAPGLLALWTLSVAAVEKTETVHFKKGATSVTITGSVKGDNGVNYMLGAEAGQAMSIKFVPDNASCYFNLYAPGADAAIHIGSTVGNEFSGTLGTSGEYRAQVYLMRNAARRNETCRYKVTFEISAISGDAGPFVGDGTMQALSALATAEGSGIVASRL